MLLWVLFIPAGRLLKHYALVDGNIINHRLLYSLYFGCTVGYCRIIRYYYMSNEYIVSYCCFMAQSTYMYIFNSNVYCIKIVRTVWLILMMVYCIFLGAPASKSKGRGLKRKHQEEETSSSSSSSSANDNASKSSSSAAAPDETRRTRGTISSRTRQQTAAASRGRGRGSTSKKSSTTIESKSASTKREDSKFYMLFHND